MMRFGIDETRRIKIDGHEFAFFCYAWDTRDGFAHGVELYDWENVKKLSEARRYYLNRTWECYRFQSAMEDAVNKAREQEFDRVAENVKRENGWKLLTKSRREELLNSGVSEMYSMLTELRKEVSNCYPNWE